MVMSSHSAAEMLIMNSGGEEQVFLLHTHCLQAGGVPQRSKAHIVREDTRKHLLKKGFPGSPKEEALLVIKQDPCLGSQIAKNGSGPYKVFTSS